jgi:hypothetical protein
LQNGRRLGNRITCGSIARSNAQARAFASSELAHSNPRSAHTQGVIVRRYALIRFFSLFCRARRAFLLHDRRFRQLHLPLPARPAAADAVPFRLNQTARAESGVSQTSLIPTGQPVQRMPNFCWPATFVIKPRLEQQGHFLRTEAMGWTELILFTCSIT